jgi:hypothetical protein
MTRNSKISLSIIAGLLITIFVILPPVFGHINANRFKTLNTRLNEFSKTLQFEGKKIPGLKFTLTNVNKGMYHSTADLIISGKNLKPSKPIKVDFYNGPVIFKNGIHFSSGLLIAQIPVPKKFATTTHDSVSVVKSSNLKNLTVEIVNNFSSSYDITLKAQQYSHSESQTSSDNFGHSGITEQNTASLGDIILKTTLSNLQHKTLTQALANSHITLHADDFKTGNKLTDVRHKRILDDSKINIGGLNLDINLNKTNTISVSIKNIDGILNQSNLYRNEKFLTHFHANNFSIKNLNIPLQVIQPLRTKNLLDAEKEILGGNFDPLQSAKELFSNQTAIEFNGLSYDGNYMLPAYITPGYLQNWSNISVKGSGKITWPQLKKDHSLQDIITVANYNVKVKAPSIKLTIPSQKTKLLSLKNLELDINTQHKNSQVPRTTIKLSTGKILNDGYIPGLNSSLASAELLKTKNVSKIEHILFTTSFPAEENATLSQIIANSHTHLKILGVNLQSDISGKSDIVNSADTKTTSPHVNNLFSNDTLELDLNLNKNTISTHLKNLNYVLNVNGGTENVDGHLDVHIKNYSIENLHIPSDILQSFKKYNFAKAQKQIETLYNKQGKSENSPSQAEIKQVLHSLSQIVSKNTAIRFDGFRLAGRLTQKSSQDDKKKPLIQSGAISMNGHIDLTWPQLKKNHTLANILALAYYNYNVNIPNIKYAGPQQQVSAKNIELKLNGTARNLHNSFNTGPLEFHYTPLGQLHPKATLDTNKIKQVPSTLTDLTIKALHLIGSVSSKDDIMAKGQANINVNNVCINKKDCFTLNGKTETFSNRSDKTIMALNTYPFTHPSSYNQNFKQLMMGFASAYSQMWTKNSHILMQLNLTNKEGQHIKQNLKVTFPNGLLPPHITGSALANYQFLDKFPNIAKDYQQSLKTLAQNKCFTASNANANYSTNISSTAGKYGFPVINLNSVDIKKCLSLLDQQHAKS